jgi:DNA-binding response OmpR family regulator
MSAPPIVIIAEPDPLISSVLRVEFTMCGFAVLLAASGQEAEEYASQAVARLIVLDTRLHLGAYDACARIRRQPGYGRRPIVLTSHEVSSTVQKVADTVGATVLLAKPYSVDDLFEAVTPFLPVDDPLLTHRARSSGVSERHTWTPLCPPPARSGDDSALTRNGRLLPIVRGAGKSIPMYVRRPGGT